MSSGNGGYGQDRDRGHSRDSSRGRDDRGDRDYSRDRDRHGGRDSYSNGDRGRDSYSNGDRGRDSYSNGDRGSFDDRQNGNNGIGRGRGRGSRSEDRNGGHRADDRGSMDYTRSVDRGGYRNGDGGGGDGPRNGGRGYPPPAGRARAAPPPSRGFPPIPSGDEYAPVRDDDVRSNGSSGSEASKRHRADSGGAGGSSGNGGGEREREGMGRGMGRGGGDRGGRGGGRGGGGRGEGRGEGGRGARRGRREEDFDLVASRPEGQTKKAVLGSSKPVRLTGNFFKVERRPDWCIYHYRVDTKPEEPDTRIKKKLMRVHSNTLGAYIFDGASLYVSHRFSPDPLLLYSTREGDQEKIELTVRLVAELAPTDIMYLQFFNIIVRKCLEAMELEEMGRNFYDRHKAIRIDAHHLELWPGYKTSMRNHEQDILLGVEITHKVLRLDNCLQVLGNLRNRHNTKDAVRDELVGTIVMTSYNRKTYKVDDIDWETTPMSTFDMRGTQITFMEYFKTKYKLNIRDSRQPMLVSRPKKRDFHRGMTGPILLIPELCQMTGLTDEMRQNNNLMKALSTHLHTDPEKRVSKLYDFMTRLRNIPAIQDELRRWGLQFQQRLLEFEGHIIPPENLLFGESKHQVPNERYDWGMAFRDKPLLSTVGLRNWVVIVPARDVNLVEKFVNAMQRVARPLKFQLDRQRDIIRVTDTRPAEYARAVDQVMNQHKDKIQMLFIILPKQVHDIYQAVKKRACQEFGVPSQCFVAKNAQNDKGLMSIATKVVVQMCAKLGGEPWTVQFPLKKLMIVGFDVYHCGKRKGSSVGAMVATTAATQAKYFSTVSYHTSREDLSEKMGVDFTKCLHAYQTVNKELPDRIIMYRDGVGDGMLKYVYETELKTIQGAIKGVYDSYSKPLPRFSFIVVTKRINTRIFGQERGRMCNPGPGTVADDVITLPERYDFYLVSQYSRQGTVSPCSYNVLYDRQGLDADKMQRLTYKLCHMYFNWNGTVTVPAPCQYAHKLAYLTGLSLGGPSHERLSHLLYFL